MAVIKPPYFGAAYYPEGWPDQRIDEDIRQMKETGINVVRLAEFAWSRLEPEEGKYDFSWLRRVIAKLDAASIGVILCTPSATPPVWLTEKYPDILPMAEDGRRTTHGARLHYCPNHEIYQEYIEKINEAMVREFDSCPNVIGWQVDNEVYVWQGKGCFCPDCEAKFHRFLEQRYGSISKLNQAWQLTLWSQEYQSFDQIPLPRSDVWHHPSLKMAWLEFQEDSVVGYVNRQYRTIKKYSRKPVGTDMMPLPLVSHNKLTKEADVVMFNHYNDEENLGNVFFWFEYLKTLCDTPLWNTETDPCGNGSTARQAYKPRGFCTVNSWLPLIFGGEANLYWHWRAHRAGHELMHGTVIDAHGRPTHTYGEVRQLAADFASCADFLSQTKVKPAKIAIHYDALAEKLFLAQPIASQMDYQPILRDYFYEPLRRAGQRVDIIPPSHDLSGYRVVISPMLPYIDEELYTRLYNWMEEGGIWIAGPLTGCRDAAGGQLEKPLGPLEEWAGCTRRYALAANEKYPFDLHDSYGEKSDGAVWYDAFRTEEGRAAAVYGNSSYELSGLAAVVERNIGKGKLILLGTVPQNNLLLRLSEVDTSGQAVQNNCQPNYQVSDNLLAVPRVAADGREAGLLLAEFKGQKGQLQLSGKAEDLRTGQIFSGRVEISPWTVMALRYVE